METKYYTPSLEEFYIGFEFEFFDDDDEDWNKIIIENQPALYNWTGLDIKKRVKYLDKEDIESLGWKLSPRESYYSKVIEKDEYQIYYYDNNLLQVYNWDDKIIFDGIIKNKSELKILLKQLNIE